MNANSGPSADLIIIGAGIHGCSAAMFAAMRGLSVIVLEKDSVARHSSGVNAGGVRRLGRHLAEIPISVRSMDIWHGISDLVGDDCGFQVTPQIKLALKPSDLEAMEGRVAQLNALGYTHETIVSPEQIRASIPGLIDSVVGGIACLDDGFAQPYQTTFAIYRKARSLGVRFFEGARVDNLNRDLGGDWVVETNTQTMRAPKILIAGGIWSGKLSALLGEPVPIETRVPMMMVTTRLRPFCNAVVGAAGLPLSFKQMPNGTVVIGGGRKGRPDVEANRSETIFEPLRLSAQIVTSLFPIMAEASVVRTWGGLEAVMPDMIPVVGSSGKHMGIYYAFGFSMHGFQLGPGTGSILAELIETGETDIDLSSLSISRFRVTSEHISSISLIETAGGVLSEERVEF